LMPLYYIMFGVILNKPVKNSKKVIAVAATSLLIISSAVALSTYYTTEFKADFRGAGEALYANTVPGDTVIYLPPAKDTMYGPLSFYYDADRVGTNILTFEDYDELIDAVDAASGNVYFVVCYQNGWGVSQYAEYFNTKAIEIFSGYEISVFKYVP